MGSGGSKVKETPEEEAARKAEQQKLYEEREAERARKRREQRLDKLEPKPEQMEIGIRIWQRYTGNKCEVGTDKDPWAYTSKHMPYFSVTPQTTCRQFYALFSENSYSDGVTMLRIGMLDPDDPHPIYLPRDSDEPLSHYPIMYDHRATSLLFFADLEPSCYRPLESLQSNTPLQA